MNRFNVTNSPLPGLKIIQRQPIHDRRGSLTRMFCSEELAVAGWNKPIFHINHTCTKEKGTVRGLHYQLPPNAEMKLVMCLQGAILDVAVDLRMNSSTFLQSHTEVLSQDNLNALLIPEGFAHGFQALTDDVEIMYCTSAPYVPSSEQGLYPKDSSINIIWPLPVIGLSDRDANHPRIDINFKGVILG